MIQFWPDYSARRNGLLRRSSPMVVAGPWPGNTLVSSGEPTVETELNPEAAWSFRRAGRCAQCCGEERVAGNDHLERRKVEADRALGVTGGVENLGWVAFKAYNEAVARLASGARSPAFPHRASRLASPSS